MSMTMLDTRVKMTAVCVTEEVCSRRYGSSWDALMCSKETRERTSTVGKAEALLKALTTSQTQEEEQRPSEVSPQLKQKTKDDTQTSDLLCPPRKKYQNRRRNIRRSGGKKRKKRKQVCIRSQGQIGIFGP